MLILPIEKKWFDMILSKKRKRNTERLNHSGLEDFIMSFRLTLFAVVANRTFKGKSCSETVTEKNSPSFIAKCTLSIGTGKEKWGAEKDKQYFVLTIHEIMRGSD